MSTNSESVSAKEIESKILDLLNERLSESSICPSEVARALSEENWRDLMPSVREAADVLAESGRIIVTQKGRKISSAVEIQAWALPRLGCNTIIFC